MEKTLTSLLEMKADGNSVWLHSSEYTREWTCSIEFSDKSGVALKLHQHGTTPQEAVEEAHMLFRRIATTGIPEMAMKAIEERV